MHTVFLGIGGNLGDRLGYIYQAQQLINEDIGYVLAESNIYETPPWGFHSSLNFYNQVLKVKTSKSIHTVLQLCQAIEKKMGRKRKAEQFSSRVIDIDILFFNKEIINEEHLQVPHQRLHLRKFVLLPLSELSPNFAHPLLKKTIAELLAVCKDDAQCEVVKPI